MLSGGLGLAGWGLGGGIAQAQPFAPFPTYHWCPGDYWDPGWGNNWEGGSCHDDHHRDVDFDNHDRDYWGDRGPESVGSAAATPAVLGPAAPAAAVHPLRELPNLTKYSACHFSSRWQAEFTCASVISPAGRIVGTALAVPSHPQGLTATLGRSDGGQLTLVLVGRTLVAVEASPLQPRQREHRRREGEQHDKCDPDQHKWIPHAHTRTLRPPAPIAATSRANWAPYTATRSTLTSPDRSNSELAETISSTTR